MPSSTASFPTEAVGNVLLSAADLAAALAPVPWLHSAVQLVAQIVALCQNVPKNRHAANQLCWRCQGLLIDMKSESNSKDPVRVQSVRVELEKTLTEIVERMDRWNGMNKCQRFLRQGEIAQDIKDSHFKIDELIRRFGLALTQGIISWEMNYMVQSERDKQELMAFLNNWKASEELKMDEILEFLGIMQAKAELESLARREQDAMVQALMEMMQDVMKLLSEREDPRQKCVQKNVLAISRVTPYGLPPDSNISGQVLRREIYHSGSKMYDVYVGSYMEEKKCAIKVLRTVETSDKIRERFLREEKIWKTLYTVDKGEYIVRLFGVCFDLGPFPCMVSEWMSGGNAIDYVRLRKDVNWKRLIRRIAEGIRVLHELDPPVVHGLIRGSNILIKEFGDPVLSDFCLSKIMQDVTGVPVSDVQGLPESYKWLAPEVIFGSGIMSIRSDIYSFAVTIVELITGNNPFPEYKRTPEFLTRLSSDKIRPRRPEGVTALERGMDNNLWELLCECWDENPHARPTIRSVLARLPETPETPW